MAFQIVQILYWLALSTWFGGVLFIAVAAPIIFRTVRERNPIMPDVLSVNLEGQHATLLAGSIVGNILARLAQVELVCGAVILISLIAQFFLIDLEDKNFTAAMLRSALFVIAFGIVLYDWRFVWPKIMKYRQEYLDHADEPDIANPAREHFDRAHKQSVTLLQAVLFLLLGMILFSGSIMPRSGGPTIQLTPPTAGSGAVMAKASTKSAPKISSKTLAQRRQRVATILPILKKMYAQAKCSLEHGNPLQLLVATILSAQCTDDRVNIVTKKLFKKYRTAKDYATVAQEELERDIQSTGFYRNKAKSIRAMAASLIEKHGGKVPQTMEELTDLAGVGRKTANVVLGNAFAKNIGVVVDTHVTRLSNRLDLTKHAVDAVKIEQDLIQIVPQEDWTLWSHLMIAHGRAICQARKPKCEVCPLLPHCPAGQKFMQSGGD